RRDMRYYFYFRSRCSLIVSCLQSELRKQTRDGQSQSFESLQQSKDNRWSVGGEPAYAALAVAISLFDDDNLIDIAERRGHGTEHRSRSLNDTGQLLENGLKASGFV